MGADEIIFGRARLGLTQRELAGLLGVDVKTVRNWEHGGHISRPNRIRLGDALGIELVSNRAQPEATDLDLITDDQLIDTLAQRLYDARAKAAHMDELIQRLETLMGTRQGAAGSVQSARRPGELPNPGRSQADPRTSIQHLLDDPATDSELNARLSDVDAIGALTVQDRKRIAAEVRQARKLELLAALEALPPLGSSNAG